MRLQFGAGRESSNLTASGRALAETQQLQDRLWSMAVANARKDMDSDVAALYIEALNDVTRVNALRVAVGLQARDSDGGLGWRCSSS